MRLVKQMISLFAEVGKDKVDVAEAVCYGRRSARRKIGEGCSYVR